MPLSVKTSGPVPKSMIREIMSALSETELAGPVHAGDVILQDVLHTGVDIVATRSVL